MEHTEGAPSGQEMSAFARVVNVFFSPARTFESIARKPGFIVPLLLLLVISIGAGFVIVPKIDIDAVVDQQLDRMEERGQPAGEEQREQLEKVIGVTTRLQPVIAGVFVIIMLLVVPSIYHGIAAAAGRATNWKAVFSAYVHVQMIGLLKGILMFFIMLPRKTLDPTRMQQLLKSNVGAFMDPETTNRAALTFLSQIDVFEIWALIVGVIALTKVTRFKTGAAAAIVGGLWLLWVVVTSLLAMLG